MQAFRNALESDVSTLSNHLRKKLNLATTDHRGRTPLHIAVEKGHENAVESLLELGADANATDAAGKTPLHNAVQHKHVDIVKRLLQADAAPDAPDVRRGWTPVHIACENRDDASLAVLLEYGVFPNGAPTSSGSQPPLHIATANGSHACIKLLLDRGCDVNAVDKSGRSALHEAANAGDGEAVALLIDASVDVESADSRGWTPLHAAAHAGSSAAVNKLLTARANVYARTKQGQSPLRLAVDQRHSQVVQTLVMHILADRETKQHTGQAGAWASRTMLADVLERRHSRVAQAILDSRFSPQTLCSAVLDGESDLTQLLLDGGCSVHATMRNRNLVSFCAEGLERIAFGQAWRVLGPGTSRCPFPLSTSAFRRHLSNTGCSGPPLQQEPAQADPSATGGAGAAASGDSSSKPSADQQLNDQFWDLYEAEAARCGARKDVGLNAWGGSFTGEVACDGDMFDDDDRPPERGSSSRGAQGPSSAAFSGCVDASRTLETLAAVAASDSHHARDDLYQGGPSVSSGEQGGARGQDARSDASRLRDCVLDCVRRLENQEALLHFLVDAGAPVVSNAGCEHPLLAAARSDSLAAASIILGSPSHSASQVVLNGALIDAARNLNVELLRLLLKHGSSPKAQQPKGEGALHSAMAGYELRTKQDHRWMVLAFQQQHLLEERLAAVVAVLLEAGVDGNSRGYKSGQNALHKLARLGEHPIFGRIASQLMSRGVRADVRDSNGATPMHAAIASGARSLVQAYIESKGDLHLTCAAGQTLLHCAAQHDRIDIARALVRAGLSASTRDGGGQTVLHALESLQSLSQWLQPPFAACMRLLDARGRSPLRKCAACAQAHRGLCKQRWGTRHSPTTLLQSSQCRCGRQLLRAYLSQDVLVQMLLVPELLSCPSRPGGRLTGVWCGRCAAHPHAGVQGDGGRALSAPSSTWEALESEDGFTFADVPLDVRIAICELASISLGNTC